LTLTSIPVRRHTRKGSDRATAEKNDEEEERRRRRRGEKVNNRSERYSERGGITMQLNTPRT